MNPDPGLWIVLGAIAVFLIWFIGTYNVLRLLAAARETTESAAAA